MLLFSRSATAAFPYSETVIYETLTDYGNWSEWFPSVSSSRLLTREGSLAIAEAGRNLPKEDTAILECVETAGKSVLVRVIEGRLSFRETNWTITPSEIGTKVSLTVRRAAWWGNLNPARGLAALGTALAAARPGPSAVPGAENVFELWETEKGLVCWVRGRKYKLVPTEE